MSIADPVSRPIPVVSEASRRGFIRFVVHHSSFIVLLFLTLLGGALRFAYLDRPPIWGDEAATFMRVCGSFQQLVDHLVVAGFAPLHYLLYFEMGRFTLLTPTVMRLPPAIAGTLMVPAIYFLAVQLVSRKTALLAAAFTACSAYMLNYSRDAKMYAEFWLFVILSFGCLLWWLRCGSRYVWYLWVICGLVMVGLHGLGAIPLAIEVLVFLSHPRALRHWKPPILFLGGLILIVGPLAGYVIYFNNFAQRVEQRGWRASGLNWIEAYNRGRDGGDLLLFTASAFTDNWEWARPEDLPQIRERTWRLLSGSTLALFGLVGLGLFPWQNFRATRSACQIPPLNSAGKAWAPPWWLGLFWVGAWLVLPAYGFYCASIPSPLSPWSWVLTVGPFPQVHGVGAGVSSVMVLACIFFCDKSWRGRLMTCLFIVAVAGCLLLLCWLLFRFVPPQPGSVWMPRYLGVVWPAFAIAVSVLLMRLPTRPLRWGAIGLLIGVNLVQHGARVFAGSEPPTDLMARDVVQSSSPDSPTRLYYGARNYGFGNPGSGWLYTLPGRYYLAIDSGRSVEPRDIKFGFEHNFHFLNLFVPPQMMIPNQVAANPRLRRVIVWDQLKPGQIDLTDRVLEKLPAGWKRTGEYLYPVRDHWTWRDLLVARRRVYERSQ